MDKYVTSRGLAEELKAARPIKGFESLYSVSSTGVVYSLPHAWSPGTSVLKQKLTNQGYAFVLLRNKKVKRTATVHRLVAEAFHTNDANLPCVNHKDGNKLNNNADNLEWCSYSVNNKHAYSIGLKTITDKQIQQSVERSSKLIYQYKNGVLINKWSSISAAARGMNCSLGLISMAASGKLDTAKGYVLRKEEYV